MTVVTIYNKTRNCCKKTKYVFYCFLDQLSQVIAQYLIYVLPFSWVVFKTKGDFLFADGKDNLWIEEQLSRGMAVATAKYLEVRLIVSGWRYVTIVIADEYLCKVS